VAPRADRPAELGASDRYELLGELHRQLQPRSYLEIGVRKGRSLALSRTRTVAVDPGFDITFELDCDLQLVRATSDELFAREHPLAHLPAGQVDLAFIDGMHLFEFALRDFMNVERHASWTSVAVFDDVLPRNVREPSRERDGMVAWAGDVFKLLEVLTEHRPDLVLLPVDVNPTGLLVVLGLDPTDAVLASRYDEIVGAHVYPDPQRVPKEILRREGAVDPAALIVSPVWAALREARGSGVPREAAWEGVRRLVADLPRLPGRELRPGQLRPRDLREPGGARAGLGRLRRRAGAARRRLRRLP
jgi:hypothetical protein